jgi:two-component system response regulator RegA
MNKSLLIVEDDTRLALSLSREFQEKGYETFFAKSIKEIRPMPFSFALVDLRLGGEYGLEAIRVIQKNAPQCRIVVLSGYGSIATAVEAVKLGAQDFVTKPASIEEIEAALMGKRKTPNPEFKAATLSQVEHEYIDFVLVKNEGNISKTAKDLGLHRQSLQRKLKKYT